MGDLDTLLNDVKALPEPLLQQAALDGVWYCDLENPEQEWLSP